MDEQFEIEKILSDVDFSQGRETAVWNKIVLRLMRGASAMSFSELDDVAGAGGLSHIEKHGDNSEDSWKK